jgi:hypothetical protein
MTNSWTRHLSELSQSQKQFDARQAAGTDIFTAAEDLPVPTLNRRGMTSAALRQVHAKPLTTDEITSFRPHAGKTRRRTSARRP